tara:strand:- start:590 stop:1078 length:489 start_codon:yes stop_codon:yes gene_type:complete
MASTISAATLTVTITEAITLNGSAQGATNTVTVDNINEISKRIVTVTHSSESGLLGFLSSDLFSTGYLAGQFTAGDVRYIRITNKDDTNHATLTFRSAGNHEFAVLLDKGHSYVVSCDMSGGVAATMDASASALTISLADLIDITAQANTAAVDLEVFVACV